MPGFGYHIGLYAIWGERQKFRHLLQYHNFPMPTVTELEAADRSLSLGECTIMGPAGTKTFSLFSFPQVMLMMLSLVANTS